MAREPFAERVAAELLEQLARGTTPLQRPWEPTTELPHNATTGKRYRGINALYLFLQGRADPRWLTYQQAQSLGAQVRRGERGMPIQYWQFAEERALRDAKGAPVRGPNGEVVKVSQRLQRPRVFHATVFNAEQIDGMPARVPRKLTWDPCERADSLLRDSGARIDHAARDSAYYMPAPDTIFLPNREQFTTRENYYAVALHELGHWTGHASRLGRDILHPFGSAAYAREELRAEIASLILGYEIGVGHDHSHHASYVASWMTALKQDPLELMRAAADAEKISTYVLGLSRDHVAEQAEELRAQQVVQPRPSVATRTEREDRFVCFWAPEPTGAELGAESLSLAYVAPFEIDGQRFLSVEHRLLLEKAHLSGGDPLAEELLRAPDAARVQALGTGVQEFDEGRHEERLVDVVLDATVAKCRQNDAIARYLLSTGDRVLVAASATDRHWGIGLAQDDPKAQDRRRWQGENLLGFALMAVRTQLRREYGIERQPQVEMFEHAGLRCSIEDCRSAVTGDTWLSGYVELPPGHPLHGYDFEDRIREEGVVVSKEITLCERTEAGMWRVGIDSASRPEIVRAEFVGHVRELAEELADRAMLRAAADVEALSFEHAGFQCSVARETQKDCVALKGSVDIPRDHPDAGKEPGHFTEWFKGSAYPRVDALESGGTRITFEVLLLGMDAARPASLSELFRRDGRLREQAIAGIKLAAEQLAGRAHQHGAMMMHAMPAQADRTMRSVAEQRRDAPHQALGRSHQAKEVTIAALPPARPRAERPERPNRHWLAVPYEERIEADARGAAWDRVAKCWYAPPGADLDKLARWEPGPTTDYAPALGARDEFAQVLRDLGCQLSGDHPIMDGRPHRIRTQGDRGSEKAGFYVASTSGVPSGYAIDNRTGEVITWRAKGFHLTSAEKAQARAAALRAQEERDRERERMHARTAEYLAKRLAEFVVIEAATPYLVAKGIAATAGVLTDREGRLTVVPGYDTSGKLWTLQYIQPDGAKRFSRNARQAGCCHPVGGWGALAHAPILILAEGYATAATIAQLTGRPTIACFNAGNLAGVAQGLRERFPGKPILIAADDDRELERKRGKNPGLEFAHKAAEAVGGRVVRPVFAPGEDSRLTDFNDLASRSVLGKVAVQQQIEASISAWRAERQRARQRVNVTRPALGEGRPKSRHL